MYASSSSLFSIMKGLISISIEPPVPPIGANGCGSSQYTQYPFLKKWGPISPSSHLSAPHKSQKYCYCSRFNSRASWTSSLFRTCCYTRSRTGSSPRTPSLSTWWELSRICCCSSYCKPCCINSYTTGCRLCPFAKCICVFSTFSCCICRYICPIDA